MEVLNKSGKQAKFMSLRFFANRFSVSEKNCTWGIRETTFGDGFYYSPVVIVKVKTQKTVVIDILRDKIDVCDSLFGRKIKLLDASMEEQNNVFVFRSKAEGNNVSKDSESVVVYVTKEEMAKLYRGKSFIPELL